MEVLANNLKRQYDLYKGEYEEKVLSILRKGWYVLGPEVEAFEREFAQYTNTNFCVGLGSGLDALWIAIKLLGIGSDDEVIVAANAYIACIMGITMNGAVPILVEPDRYNLIDTKKIEDKITPKTKAILAVHLFGQSCDMDAIMHIAEKYNLKVVEDCAQSHGTLWNGKMTGTYGDVGCFSFYPTKGLGAFGEGGAIITNNEELAHQVKVFRNYGSEKKYHNEVVGTNSRLDELQAGLLRVKLKHLDEMNLERKKLARCYLERIKNSKIELPVTNELSSNTWHQFVIKTSSRNELAEYLSMHKIGSMIHYPIPPHLSKAYQQLGYHLGDFPITEKAAAQVLSLPMYNGMREDEQSFVIDTINSY